MEKLQFESLEERSLLSAAPVGGEFQLNTTVANNQSLVAIGSNPSSTQLIMAWTSNLEDGGGDGVYARRYDLNGSPIGAAFRVNGTTSGNQTAAAVGMDSLGNFVVTWQSSTGDGSGDGIYARRYAYDGTALATEFRVNTTTSGNQQAPAIAMTDDGRFAVAFQSATGDASGNAVYTRVYTAAGVALGNDFLVNQFLTGNQQASAIAMDPSGAFVVTWQSAAQDLSGDTIVARRYGNTGSPLATEFIVNQFTAGNQSAPSIAANADGSFVIAWQSAGQDVAGGDAIVARRYDSSGTALANEFVVNQFTAGNQSAPNISASAAGFAIAWQSAGQDVAGADAVVVRSYDASGVVTGNEAVVNVFTTGAQNNAAVAMQSDGDFVVAWQSPGQETGGGGTLGAFARRFNAVNDAPVLKQIANYVTDVGGTLAFTALATDQDAPTDVLTYSLAAGAPAGATINPSTGAFSWSTAVGVTPGRYFVTVEVRDVSNALDSKEVALTVFAPGERTALDDYVNTLDPAYKWDIRSRVDGDGYTKYNILLTSGTWRTAAEVSKPLWEHWMVVYVPDEILVDRALLFIDGGSNSSTPPTSSDIDGYAGLVATSTGAVIVDLFSIPSQPLTFTGVAGAKTEDQILAYSWKKYLETGDPTWPAQLPMTRAAMRALDAVSDFMGSPVGGNFDIGSFVVTGGSKRGWTTWLAAAADPRVSEITPIVSDLLNTEASFVHHYAYYNGAFSAAVQDYVAAGVLNVNNFGTEAMDKLLQIVDPYTYVNRLTLPKFIVNVANDEFFVPDSWKYYYDALIGPKSMRYLANSSHGVSDPQYYLDIFGVFGLIVQGGSLPEYEFHQLADGTIVFSSDQEVSDVKLWKATNTTKRDFRYGVAGSTYTSTPLSDLGGGVFQGNVSTPPAGYTAYYIQATINNELGLPVTVSSGIYLKGNPPTNNAPTLQPINDVVLVEGSPLLINNSASDVDPGQTLTYSFYNYPYAIPPQVSIVAGTGVVTGSWTDQTTGAVPITVQVWDNGPTPLPDRKTFRVTVVNAAPSASLSGPSSGTPGQSYAFTLLATDPSSVDQAAGFTFKIDWNGDGIDDQTVVGLSGTSVNHTFAAGNYNVRVTATDKDGGISTASTHAISLNQAPIDPLNQLPLSINEGDSLLLAALGWTDPNNDPLTYTWDVDNDGQYDDATGSSVTLSWSALVALGLGDGDSTHTVRLRVDDGVGGVTVSGPVTLTIHNVSPTSSAGLGYSLAEGSSLALVGVGTDPAGASDPLSYSWDVNGDLTYGDATGATPTLSWAQLQALGITGVGTFNVRLQVNDGDGGLTTSAPVTLSVINAAPVASIVGPAAALRGEAQTFTVSATDKPADVTAGFNYVINWGDGSPDDTTSTALGTSVSHTFNVTGLVTVSVTATDQFGASSSVATTAVQVDAVQLRPNGPLVDLVWGGTTGADHLELEQLVGTTIRVRELGLNGSPTNNVQDFAGITGRAIALASAGNDVLDARGLSSTQATLNGNAGSNTLYGGPAGDLLIGGSNGAEGQQGNNVIIAGNGTNTIYGNDVTGAEGSTGGNNLIVGGSGQDTIYGTYGSVHKKDGSPSTGGEGGQNLIVGGGGADFIYASQIIDGAEGGNGSLIVSGSTNLDQSALLSVLSEWTSTRTYAQKVANIQGTGVGPRSNDGNFLQSGVTVLEDSATDQLYSDTHGSENWLLFSFGDDLAQRVKPTDTIGDL